MRGIKRICAVSLLIFTGLVQAEQADTNTPNTFRGQGQSPCSEFMDLVNGNWSHPLNALNFHGFMSWAQGMVSGYNQYSGEAPVEASLDDLKMALVDQCDANPDQAFGDAVLKLISPNS